LYLAVSANEADDAGDQEVIIKAEYDHVAPVEQEAGELELV